MATRAILRSTPKAVTLHRRATVLCLAVVLSLVGAVQLRGHGGAVLVTTPFSISGDFQVPGTKVIGHGVMTLTTVDYKTADGQLRTIPAPTTNQELGRGANGAVFFIPDDPTHVLKLPIAFSDGRNDPVQNIGNEARDSLEQHWLLNYVQEQSMADGAEPMSSDSAQDAVFREYLATRIAIPETLPGFAGVRFQWSPNPFADKKDAPMAKEPNEYKAIEKRGGLSVAVKQRVNGVTYDEILAIVLNPDRYSPEQVADAAQATIALKTFMLACSLYAPDGSGVIDGATTADGKAVKGFHLTDWKTSNLMWGVAEGHPTCEDHKCVIAIDLMQRSNHYLSRGAREFYRETWGVFGGMGFGSMYKIHAEMDMASSS